jgi:hypothetical protein
VVNPRWSIQVVCGSAYAAALAHHQRVRHIVDLSWQRRLDTVSAFSAEFVEKQVYG